MTAPVHWIETGDHSITLERGDGVAFRSRHGAQAESQHVFCAGAFKHRDERAGPTDRTLRVLELGLGAGTNFITTSQFARTSGRGLQYAAAERSPVDAMLFSSPTFVAQAPDDADFLYRVFSAARPGRTTLHHRYDDQCLTVHWGPLAEWTDAPTENDAFYFDPFGVRDDRSAWTEDAFRAAFACLAPHGRLCTYGAATAVRNHMARAGFYVGVRPGSGGKRECTVAAKAPEHLGDAKLKLRPLPRARRGAP